MLIIHVSGMSRTPQRKASRGRALHVTCLPMAARKRVPRSPIEKDPNRPLIERALAMGIAMSVIGRRFGYTPEAICRYRDRMPQQLKAAIVAAALKPKEADLDKLRIEESEGILGNLAHQRARLLIC